MAADDLAFRHLNEQKYREISKILASKRAVREEYIETVCTRLKGELLKFGVEAEVIGRPKGIYSTYKKCRSMKPKVNSSVTYMTYSLYGY
ncbi:MAG: hypothetical protein Ct9H300mP11_26010 [Chloroflexota bacterium]|nr:MAG: hypothetical protein Ct9H300mP11_26010 [Chloroflexota bacterium]